MAVDILAMQELLRWEGVPAEAHLAELRQYDEFNFYISEYFETPPPAQSVLDALAVLMDWSGDAKQIVTKMTGQRHTEEERRPEKFKQFLGALEERRESSLPEARKSLLQQKMTESISWQKFDNEAQSYRERTPMNSYDVLKCSQALFHLFEWLRLTQFAEEDRPPRYVEIDIKAFREKEREMRPKGTWPPDPPAGPAPRD
eukprot:TRINITY_DN105484_c0_g1_i1.p1 TRINITY_DN105484_c0_g1~~TRINITY_DN105484_c0_g1_i1.p1  ORF type:complete len:201 (+),score=48.89 TRINITY_DN105484_c0_g1_i1:47-649(+)